MILIHLSTTIVPGDLVVSMKRCLTRAVALFSLAASTAGAAGPTASTAPIQPVVETRYGEKLSDPYRWMEAMGPEFISWVRAQDRTTRDYFSAMPGYPDFVRQEKRAYEAEVKLSDFQRVGDMLYYKRQGAKDAQPSLYVKPLAGGAERRLVDPEALSGPTATITYYAPSPDNRRLVYAMALGGSEESDLHFLDLASARRLPEVIDRA